MARTWLSIEVELVSGLGQDLWPRPGRVIVARRTFSFRALAESINDAFGRWDRAHLHLFEVDETLIVPTEWWDDPPAGACDDSARLSLLEAGQQFVYEFDLGDSWEHLCTVGQVRVDPMAVLGVVPDRPMACWGWGELPDQYGRRFNGDDGTGGIPPPPDPPLTDLPPLRPHWGDRSRWTGHNHAAADVANSTAPGWDDQAFRSLAGAIARVDGTAVVELLAARDPVEVLQHMGDGLLIALAAGVDSATGLTQPVVAKLRARSWAGDNELADRLEAAIGAGARVDLEPVAVSLDELPMHLEGDPAHDEGWRIDVDTGQWWPHDPQGFIGEEPPDHWEDPDRWLFVDSLGSRDGWRDMADFIGRVDDDELAAQLDRAIHGRGAFRRFKDVLWPHEAWRHAWFRFSAERQRGRARAWLADAGYCPIVVPTNP